MNPCRFSNHRTALRAACATLFAICMVLMISAAMPVFAADPPAMENVHSSDQNDPFPITVTVKPSLVVVLEGESGMVGRKVAIEGRTLSMGPGSARPVRIAIDSDDPPVHTIIEATVDGDGNYANSEFAPLQAGEYTITVTAPDDRGTTTTTLTAISVPDLGKRASESLEKAMTTVDQTLDVLERKIDEKPDSPAKTEAKQKLANIRPAHKAFEKTRPAEAIHGFFGALGKHEALLANQAAKLREAAQTVAKLEKTTEQLERMRGELGAEDMVCEAMAKVLEVAKAVSTVLGFEAKLTAQVAAMSKDVAADLASNKAKQSAGAVGGLAAGFLVKNGKKLATGSRVIEGTKSANALAADFAAFAVEQVFDAYCKRFVGPVEGTFTGKFYRMVRGKRTMWWKQSYKLSGRILLHYPKSAAGKHIKMTGRIEGYAHSFASWDKGMKAYDEKGIMGGAIVAKLRYPPLDIKGESGARAMSQGGGLLSAQVWGSIAGMAFPNSFAMNVRGEYNGDSILLLIGKRLTDFHAYDKVVNVIVSPLNTLGPTVVWYPLPYVDGHSVIAGGAGDKPIELAITTQGKVMTAKGKIDNVKNTKSARGEYHLQIKMCNPGC